MDGAIIGLIQADTLLQAKGKPLLTALLGGYVSEGTVSGPELSPPCIYRRDYHRIHLPLAGRLREMGHSLCII